MSATRYHIADGRISQMREYSSAPVEALIKQLASPTIKATPALPSNTRFFVQSGNTTFVIVEMRPSVQTLHVNTYYEDNIEEGEGNAWSHEEDEVQELKLAMPWQYFVFKFTKSPGTIYDSLVSFHVYWAQKRVNVITDQVYVARVPNIHDGGEGCLGDLIPDATHSIAERVEYIVDNFYSESSEFNMDLSWTLPAQYKVTEVYDADEGTYKASRYRPYQIWVRDTARNKFCWQNWEMDQSTQGLNYFLSIHPSLFDPNGNDEEATLDTIFSIIGEATW